MTTRLSTTRGSLRVRIRQFAVELREAPDAAGLRIQVPEDAVSILSGLIGRKDREHIALIHMCVRGRVIGAEIISVGNLDSAIMHPREVFKAAILTNAHAIILGHNHPSGDLTPSREDRQMSSEIRKAGEILGISVLDCIIVSGDRWARIEGA